MKLILTETEAKEILGARFNLSASEIEVVFSNSFSKPSIQIREVEDAIRVIFAEGCSETFPNKIGLIKAIRTLTDAGLKEGKDLAESLLGETP